MRAMWKNPPVPPSGRDLIFVVYFSSSPFFPSFSCVWRDDPNLVVDTVKREKAASHCSFFPGRSLDQSHRNRKHYQFHCSRVFLNRTSPPFSRRTKWRLFPSPFLFFPIPPDTCCSAVANTHAPVSAPDVLCYEQEPCQALDEGFS